LLYFRKADTIFGEEEEWKNVSERERRELFDDVVHLVAKREKVFKKKMILIYWMF
jgi:pre-mRNA-processing factor 40